MKRTVEVYDTGAEDLAAYFGSLGPRTADIAEVSKSAKSSLDPCRFRELHKFDK
ncbi:MAG TPA: hypothetical protein VD907_01020 [Verrucomicrobiae bacterium]|nr:hypothetical protein [Verrucomicrobiae bacterium]